jgi:hypothetical protein
MTSTSAQPRLAVIGHSAAGRPRTFRLEFERGAAPGRNAAYRHLMAVILGLDVPTLAHRHRHTEERFSRLTVR